MSIGGLVSTGPVPQDGAEGSGVGVGGHVIEVVRGIGVTVGDAGNVGVGAVGSVTVGRGVTPGVSCDAG